MSRPSAASRTSFAQLERELPGRIGLAVAPLGRGRVETFGVLQLARAWSTSKVPVLVRLLYDYERRRRSLDAQERDWAAAAIARSDNPAIRALFAQLEALHGGLAPASRAVELLLRRAGDRSTVINTLPNARGFTTYGQTLWSATGEVQFYRALARGCLLDPGDTQFVLSLMESVTPSQRWGVGEAGFPAEIPMASKGGWGPLGDGTYEVRQTAIVGTGPDGYVLSILATANSGMFAAGTGLLSAVARWARAHLPPGAATPAASCARPSSSGSTDA